MVNNSSTTYGPHLVRPYLPAPRPLAAKLNSTGRLSAVRETAKAGACGWREAGDPIVRPICPFCRPMCFNDIKKKISGQTRQNRQQQAIPGNTYTQHTQRGHRSRGHTSGHSVRKSYQRARTQRQKSGKNIIIIQYRCNLAVTIIIKCLIYINVCIAIPLL